MSAFTGSIHESGDALPATRPGLPFGFRRGRRDHAFFAFPHRAAAAFFASARRCSGDTPSQRAFYSHLSQGHQRDEIAKTERRVAAVVEEPVEEAVPAWSRTARRDRAVLQSAWRVSQTRVKPV